MHLTESFPALMGLGDVQWTCMVTLFVASVVTLALYLVQCFLCDLQSDRPESDAVTEEADALLTWALSLKTWKSQWRGAWCRALNDESRKSRSSVQLTFEEDNLQPSELVIGHVFNFNKTYHQKAVRCKVAGDELRLSAVATGTTTAPAEPFLYRVTLTPLRLQLDLQTREAEGEVLVTWGLSESESWDLQVTPISTQEDAAGPSVSAIRDRLRTLLRSASPSLVLSCRPALAAQVKENQGKIGGVTSPPKPPRAHDWKLLVKNIRVTLNTDEGDTGSMEPLCLLQLDDPPQRFSSTVLKNTASPSWDQPFIFELSGRSKELGIQVLDDGKPQESSLLGQVSVPFDLVKKQPKGQQTFALTTKDQVTGSFTAEFTYLEPSEVRSWQAPTPAPAKKVEMDRTVMPCGTVVTTVTAVKSKPGRAPLLGFNLESPMKSSKSKLSERRVSEQPSMLSMTVNKALSSSDTELLMLNGTDPVAEAAIRQLHQSAKQKLKSPVKKSTIIISGVAKTPLSQHDEMALMAGYAAAMDASMSDGCQREEGTGGGPAEPAHPPEGASGGAGAEDWESQTGEDPEADKTSLSTSVSESGSKRSRGSFLHKSAKLFFRRRHQRKEPGMSQSHNDLVYLEQPGAGEKERRMATFSRIINRKLLPKSRSKANGERVTPLH